MDREDYQGLQTTELLQFWLNSSRFTNCKVAPLKFKKNIAA